ncbi:MAG TPA: hypothetical protein VEH76_05890 [Methylocystis sp.]|nr:hypothetical protein [Methylocystis sp.]
MDNLRNLPTRLSEAATAASERLSQLNWEKPPQLADARDFASAWLQRAKRARLSPLDALVLGGLALFAAGSFAYLLICALAPVTGEVSGKPDWRPPTAETPKGRPAGVFAGALESETLTRPLFDKSRRPPAKTSQKQEAPTTSEAALAGPPAGMTLKGIVNQGRDKRVFIVTASTPDGAWLKIGESLEGWTFDSVADARVTLTRAGQVAHLEFNYDEASPGSAPPPQPLAQQPPQQPPQQQPRARKARVPPQ